MKDPFVRALIQLASHRRDVMLLTGDLGFGAFESFAQRFPKQFLNVGIAEQNMIGIASGLALEGFTVFTYSIGNFGFMRCLEQIRNDACYHDLNVNVVSMGGGFSYGALGISHHLTEDLAMLRALPATTVMCPSDDWEAEAATLALAQKKGVGYLRLDKTVAFLDHTEEEFKIGRAKRYGRGHQVCILACGGIVREAMSARDRLTDLGVTSSVLTFPTLKPFDEAAVAEVAREATVVITVEEHSVNGGLGGAVAEVLMERTIVPRHFIRLGLRDTFSSVVGSQDYLRKIYKMDADAIVDAATQALHSNVTYKERYRESGVETSL